MKRSFILLLIVLFSVNLLSQGSTIRKNPYFSGSLSWYYPGLGQAYNGKILKGALFLTLELGSLYTAINLVSDLTFRLEEGVIVNPHSDITRGNRNIAIGLAVGATLLHIYNIYDAISDSMKFNLRNASSLKSESPDPFFLAVSSYLMPGTGQMFNGSFRKGSELLFYQLLFKVWKVYIDYDLRNRYSPEDSALNWLDLNQNDRVTIIAYYAMNSFFRIYSAYDAYIGGHKKVEILMMEDSRKNLLLGLGVKF